MTDEARETVAVVLMKSEEADATLAVLRRDCPQVRISDHGTFWMLKAEDEIAVDLGQVATDTDPEADTGMRDGGYRRAANDRSASRTVFRLEPAG